MSPRNVSRDLSFFAFHLYHPSPFWVTETKAREAIRANDDIAMKLKRIEESKHWDKESSSNVEREDRENIERDELTSVLEI